MAPLTALLGGKITLSLCICPHRLQFSTTCNDTDLVLFHTELPFVQDGPRKLDFAAFYGTYLSCIQKKWTSPKYLLERT